MNRSLNFIVGLLRFRAPRSVCNDFGLLCAVYQTGIYFECDILLISQLCKQRLLLRRGGIFCNRPNTAVAVAHDIIVCIKFNDTGKNAVKKGFDGVKGYFAESLRRNAYTQEADNAVSTEPEQEAYTPPEKQAPSPAQEEKKIPQQEEVPDEEDSGDDEVPLNPSSDSGSSDDEDSQVEQEDVPDETDDGLFYDDEVDDESKW